MRPTAVLILGMLLFCGVAGVQASDPPEEREGCESPSPFQIMPELGSTLAALPPESVNPAHPREKTTQNLKLESNDDLAALSFPGEVISPYVGASIDLLPLPNNDPATASQVLAYGLGAGFGCDLGSARLSFRYHFRFFPEDEGKNGLKDEEEIHRISFGLQKSF